VLLNNFTVWRQQHADDCLVACCKMVLAYLGIDKDENWLWRRLVSRNVTPFSSLTKLGEELGLQIEIAYDGDLTTFEPYIESGLPIIVAVDADIAKSWPYEQHHAIVVVGFTDHSIFVHDPAQSEMPLEIESGTFMLAWSRRDYEYAIIRLENQ